MKRPATKTMVIVGLLVAVEVVLSRFCSISTWNLKISFSFLPAVLAAVLLGPVAAGTVGALGDFIGAVLFPIGPYFPGFTLTAFLTGLVFGWFLHKRQTLWRILGAVAFNLFVLSLLLQTVWISLLYDAPYMPLLLTRSVQCGIMAPIQFFSICFFVKVRCRYWKRSMA